MPMTASEGGGGGGVKYVLWQYNSHDGCMQRSYREFLAKIKI